jgi:cold shock CspA family protein
MAGTCTARPKPHTGLAAGKAPRGYGFIRRADGNALYFTSDNLVNISFDQLQEGHEVKLIEEMAAEGPQAKRVSIGHHHIPL